MNTAILRQIVRYGVIGIGSVIIYISLLWVLVHYSPFSELVANAAAYSTATFVNYLFNFYWSFESKRTHAQASWRFALIVILGVAMNSIFVRATVATGVRVEVAALVFSALWPLASFMGLKFWALR